MIIRFEKRREPSKVMQAATPIGAVVLTMIVGAIIFDLIGYDGPRAVKEIFFTPIFASYKWQDVARKAAPLILIALGLCLGNRAKVWNIGAEGQYLVGGMAGATVAYFTAGHGGVWVIALMIVAGLVAGALWAAIPAFLKTRLRVNEILSSLMLVYVAQQLLGYLVTGPLKDPNGQNFPQTAPFADGQRLPSTLWGTPIPPGLVAAFVLAFVFFIVMERSEFGLGVRAIGEAPKAARYGGYDANRLIWQTLMISGAMAGLAGLLEVDSQTFKLDLGFTTSLYGFTAIIVSFLGRLHPLGAVLAGLVLAISSVGGQVAQTAVHVPYATAGIFQATMLFFILASDVLVRKRIVIVSSEPARKALGGAA